MPFVKGMPKPEGSGRKAGMPRKKPQMKPLRVQLAELGFNTGSELVALYRTTADNKQKLQILDLIVKYTNIIPTVEHYVENAEGTTNTDNEEGVEEEPEQQEAAQVVNFLRD